MEETNFKITVVGLGYVGLPLAVEFSKKFPTTGFDINKSRIEELKNKFDSTNEVNNDLLKETIVKNLDKSSGLLVTNKISDIGDSNVYIITVPTPVDKNNNPDLTPIINATNTISPFIKTNDIIVYESTVYPGLTEEICVPIIENKTNKKLNHDFFIGYSPERINPGDRERTLTKIKKVVSASNDKTLKKLTFLYSSIIEAGVYSAPTIKVAEAAKVIENSQRDINIAFINELAKIFNLMDIDTTEVLKAASTKWNFLPFKPGLVGGHCIGVDPYYLAQRASTFGYHPEIILSGRRINDSMGKYVANQVVKKMISRNQKVFNSRILVLGFTFKENCPDYRNTKVIDIISELKSFSCEVSVHDPWIDKIEISKNLKSLNFIENPDFSSYEAIILAVSHTNFLEIDFKSLIEQNILIYDVKSFINIDGIEKL